MARIPQEFIDELMSRVDIVDVIDARVPLKKAGKEYVACCPFHNEKTPSFTVSPSKQFYHCFGCGANGSALGFLMEYEHMGFVEAVHELAGLVNLPVPAASGGTRPQGDASRALYEVLERVADYYQGQLREHSGAVDYLKGRGIRGDIAAEFRLGYALPGWNHLEQALGDSARGALIRSGMVIEKDDGGRYDRFRDRVMFPIRDGRGRIIAFGGRVLGDGTPKYLNSPETPVFHKGRELYGLYEARKASRDLPRLLVVEGYMDVISLAQAGIRYAVATLGTATTADHLEKLFRVTPEVVFCFDGDRAGREAAWRALENALPAMRDGRQVKFMFLPDGEDPDTLVRKLGSEGFTGEIAKGIPLSQFFFQGLSAKTDISSMDGRARLVELARPMLSNLPQGVFRDMMVARLAELTRIERRQLAGRLGGTQPVPGGATQRRRRGAPVGSVARSPVRLAIALLLQRPDLAGLAGDTRRFAELDMPGVELLISMLDLLAANPNLTSGALLERWRDTEHGAHLAKLASWRPLVDEGLDAEFAGVLKLLDLHCLEQRTERLLQKAQLDTLSPEEKRELQELLIRSSQRPKTEEKSD